MMVVAAQESGLERLSENSENVKTQIIIDRGKFAPWLRYDHNSMITEKGLKIIV